MRRKFIADRNGRAAVERLLALDEMLRFSNVMQRERPRQRRDRIAPPHRSAQFVGSCTGGEPRKCVNGAGNGIRPLHIALDEIAHDHMRRTGGVVLILGDHPKQRVRPQPPEHCQQCMQRLPRRRRRCPYERLGAGGQIVLQSLPQQRQTLPFQLSQHRRIGRVRGEARAIVQAIRSLAHHQFATLDHHADAVRLTETLEPAIQSRDQCLQPHRVTREIAGEGQQIRRFQARFALHEAKIGGRPQALEPPHQCRRIDVRMR